MYHVFLMNAQNCDLQTCSWSAVEPDPHFPPKEFAEGMRCLSATLTKIGLVQVPPYGQLGKGHIRFFDGADVRENWNSLRAADVLACATSALDAPCCRCVSRISQLPKKRVLLLICAQLSSLCSNVTVRPARAASWDAIR